jgi:hypothetical protein
MASCAEFTSYLEFDRVASLSYGVRPRELCDSDTNNQMRTSGGAGVLVAASQHRTPLKALRMDHFPMSVLQCALTFDVAHSSHRLCKLRNPFTIGYGSVCYAAAAPVRLCPDPAYEETSCFLAA